MDVTMGFEEAWPALDKRLRGALAGRRVPVDLRDDIVQETGLRLFRHWSSVRPESAWAFALTIAINLVRDEMRRCERQDPSRLETPGHQRDAEQDALVRIELQRVGDALAAMSARQRSILLAEIGEESHGEASGAALKMARMRARKRLRSMLEQASGFVLLGFDRLRRLIGAGDPAISGALSAVGRPVAVASITAMGILGVFGPDTSSLFNGGNFGANSRPTQIDSVAGTDRALSLRREPAGAILFKTTDGGAATRTREGSGDGLVIDPDNPGIPPYEAEHEIAPGTFGENETRVGVQLSHGGAQCGGDSAQPTSACTGVENASVTATVAAGGDERKVTVGPGSASALVRTN